MLLSLSRNNFVNVPAKQMFHLLQFRKIQQVVCTTPKNFWDNFLFTTKMASNFSIIQLQPSRYIHCSSFLPNKSSHEQQNKPKASLFFVQNPLTWLIIKLDFFMLKKSWDPSFDELEFRTGTKQAVCTVTNLLSENKFDKLEGLLTKSALNETRREVETEWSDEQRRNIALTEDNIQVAVPRKVHFKKDKSNKLCDVDIVFLAVKPDPYTEKSVILIEVNARFHREYSDFALPEWTISIFKVPRFKVIKSSMD